MTSTCPSASTSAMSTGDHVVTVGLIHVSFLERYFPQDVQEGTPVDNRDHLAESQIVSCRMIVVRLCQRPPGGSRFPATKIDRSTRFRGQAEVPQFSH